jgi:hypothetical protein
MNTQNLFVKGLENISQNSNNDVNDKTYVGVIIDIIGTKKYVIRYNDAERKFNTKYNGALTIGDIVHIVYPMGSSSNAYMIEDVKFSSGSGTAVSGVSSVDGRTGDVDLSDKYSLKNKEHSHDNKEVLDKISSERVGLWDLKAEISEFTSIYDFPTVGKKGVVYIVTKGDNANKQYRWDSVDLKYYELSHGNDWHDIKTVNGGEIK